LPLLQLSKDLLLRLWFPSKGREHIANPSNAAIRMIANTSDTAIRTIAHTFNAALGTRIYLRRDTAPRIIIRADTLACGKPAGTNCANGGHFWPSQQKLITTSFFDSRCPIIR
jgi:hypothetical protein